MLAAFLNQIDIFGVPVTMNFYGKPKSKSRSGGICSLLLFLFVVWVIYNASRDLFAQTNPNTISSQTYNDDPPEMVLSTETFPLAFQIESTSGEAFIDDKIYKLSLFHTLTQQTRNDNGTVVFTEVNTEIKTERCTFEHFGELASRYSLVVNSPSLCIARNQTNLDRVSTIQGVYGSPVYQILTLQLSECDNITSQGNCALKGEIESRLSGAWFGIIYPNMVINPRNFDRPDSKFQEAYFSPLNVENVKDMLFRLSHVEMKTDSGWLVESIETKNYVIATQISETSTKRSSTNNIIASATFGANKLVTQYSRKYKKIQDTLAEIGGMANTALVFLIILTTPYFKYKYREALMNEIFHIPNPQQGNKRKRRSRKAFDNDQRLKNIQKRNEKGGASDSPEVPVLGCSLKIIDKKEMNINNRIDTGSAENKKGIDQNSLTQELADLTPYALGLSHESPNKSHNDKDKKILITSPPLSVETNRKEGSFVPFMPNLDKPKKIDQVILREPEWDIPKSENLASLRGISGTSKEKDPDFPSLALEGVGNVKQSINNDQEVVDNEINISPDIQENEKARENARAASIAKVISRFKIVDETNKTSKGIRLTPWEYLCSFIYRSRSLKKKIAIINEGIQKVDMRLDVVNIMKKLREIDKLRALLLDKDQLVLFNNLPKPEIKDHDSNYLRKRYYMSSVLTKSTFIDQSGSNNRVVKAYERIQQKQHKTGIDEKLLMFFEDVDS